MIEILTIDGALVEDMPPGYRGWGWFEKLRVVVLPVGVRLPISSRPIEEDLPLNELTHPLELLDSSFFQRGLNPSRSPDAV